MHLAQRTLPNRQACPSANRARAVGARKMVCKAAATTAWEAWTPYMQKRTAVAKPKANELEQSKDLANAISKSAVGFKPKYGANVDVHGTTFKLQHAGKVNLASLPKDLHEKLEAVGVIQVKAALGIPEDGELDVSTTSYTTTDINAGLAITGCVAQKGSERSAVVAFVCTETEREASWSRLEGLLLHWACSEASGAAWTMPPAGWSSIPAKAVDAGGAWQNSFEKQTLAGSQEKLYVMVMQLPLRGALKSGGLTFVLKASSGPNTKWLKDSETDKDFFLDLQKLPMIKL
mmetsp:Transcript_16100/g.34835  ORF Transcript_16100/g.34835 Transcript_16100/m.34835 type:complete len:290 (+) Transcript_16100:299-1168(+)